MKWRDLNTEETEPAVFGHWWDGEMREKEESRTNPGISGLVDLVDGGATLQQGHREAAASVIGK